MILTDYFDDALNRPVETAIIMPTSEISCLSFPLAKVVVNRPQALPPSSSFAVAASGVSRPAPDQVSPIVSAPAQALPPRVRGSIPCTTPGRDETRRFHGGSNREIRKECAQTPDHALHFALGHRFANLSPRHDIRGSRELIFIVKVEAVFGEFEATT